MTDETLGSWSERQRLIFIERKLFWTGHVNRVDLCARFNISKPQASNDFTTYTTLNPTACFYNVRRKRYELNEGMEPVFLPPDLGADWQSEKAFLAPDNCEDWIAMPDFPRRPSEHPILQRLSLATHRGEALKVFYYSLKSGAHAWRTISPRRFSHDSFRWHVRAWCHTNQDFRDFAVPRISKVQSAKGETYHAGEDLKWENIQQLVIRPNPALDPQRRKVMELDYCMKRGELILPVREALVYYVLMRLGFPAGKALETGGLPLGNESGHLELREIRKTSIPA